MYKGFLFLTSDTAWRFFTRVLVIFLGITDRVYHYHGGKPASMAVLASRPDGCAWRLAGRLVSVKPAIELQSICPPSLETSASVMGKSKGRKKKTRTDGSPPGVPREDRRDAGHEQASPDGEPPTLQPGDDISYPDSRQSPSSRTPRDNSRRKTALDVRLQPEDQSNLEGRMAEAAESGGARTATHQPSEQELGKKSSDDMGIEIETERRCSRGILYY